MTSRLTSPIWNYYDILETDKGKAKCKLCAKVLSRGGSVGHKMTTTNLRNHLKNVHSKVYSKMESAQLSFSEENFPSTSKSILRSRKTCGLKGSDERGERSDKSLYDPDFIAKAGTSLLDEAIHPLRALVMKQTIIQEMVKRKEMWARKSHGKGKFPFPIQNKNAFVVMNVTENDVEKMQGDAVDKRGIDRFQSLEEYPSFESPQGPCRSFSAPTCVVPDLSERMGMENQPSPGKLEGSSSYLTCSPIISTMSGLHEDMMSGAGPSSSCQESGDNESMHQDYDQDDIDVKSEPVFNVEPEICEDESQNNTQSSCDRRSSQSSPAPAGMAGPYLLKKETHCTTILDQLLRDDTFCDVTLTAEGQSMRAHKIVLCLASAYFRQVLSKEANVQNVIVFRDIKFAELKNLINFIYTGEATVDAAELESFMKTAEMLEVTSLCDGQRKIPKNLIPKPRDTESERTRTNIPTKRALNASSTPPPAKSRKVDDSFKTTKSISQASTSGGTTHQSSVLHQTPQVFLHSPPVIKSEPATEDENPEEEFRTFESLTQSPGYQESDTTQSTDNDTGPSVNKAPVGGCPFCPSLDQILTGVTLTQHLSTTHPDKTVYPCQTCSRVFLKKGAYDQHIENCNR